MTANITKNEAGNWVLYAYQTGDQIRELTEEEVIKYMELSDNGNCNGGTGTVDGEEFGYNGTVYAQ